MSHPLHQIPLRAALVDYGYAGKLLHAALTDATPGLYLQVIGSNRSDAVHAGRPDMTVYMPEATAMHADVDLVVIATPNDHHAPLVEATLRTGKHVVADKPFIATLVEARHLARVAHDTGRVLLVFQNRHQDSNFLAMQATIGDGALGEVMHAEAHLDRYRPQVRVCWCE